MEVTIFSRNNRVAGWLPLNGASFAVTLHFVRLDAASCCAVRWRLSLARSILPRRCGDGLCYGAGARRRNDSWGVAVNFRSMGRTGRRLAASGVFLLWGSGGGAAEPTTLFQNPDAVDVWLITAVPGNRFYDNFGHTALRLIDHASAQDLVFNWGIFDFSNSFMFGVRFYKGDILYRLGYYPAEQNLPWLKSDGRTVYEDLLQLTRGQKARLLSCVLWDMQPENREYSYDYFYANCATRPRDYLDYALSGALTATFRPIPTGERYRDMVRSHYRSLPPVDLFLDVMMNSRIDMPMSRWDKGFLPLALRAMLQNSTNPAIDGGSAPIIGQTRENRHDGPTGVAPLGGHLYYLLLEGLLMMGCLGAFYLRRGKTRESSRRHQRTAMRFLGVAAWLYALLPGIMGVAMPLNWLYLVNPDSHHNVNMIFFWPLDLLYFYWGWHWLRYGQKLVLHRKAAFLFARSYQDLHVVLMVLGMILWASGIFQQDICHVAIYVLPPTLLLWLAARRHGFGWQGAGS